MHRKSDPNASWGPDQIGVGVGSQGRESATRAADVEEMAAIRAIVEGTARGTGDAFFRSLVRHLAAAVGVEFAFVAEFAAGRTRVRTLAYWSVDKIRENVEYDLAGTPCEDVVLGGVCHHPSRVRELFPGDQDLIELEIESYLGVPLLDEAGTVLGHLAVFDRRPMPAEPRRMFIFRIFAARAAVELERLRGERRLAESERRYRDLYEEAPNAYVSIGIDGRLASVNRRASRLLGRPAADLVGSPMVGLCAESPEGKARAVEALRQCGSGGEIDGLELEMRRADGSPLWVSLWMKPLRGDDGNVHAVHSIWLDITYRVLAERERARLLDQNLYLREEIASDHDFDEIIGRGPGMRGVLDMVARVAPTDATVLISGETGTGKELIARAVHSNSRRRDRPLIKLNCASLPAGLVESELFGHEKGAFTGAIARRLGRFELADGGTIFLDEVGELPSETQAKLLRVLQEREFERVGGGEPIKVDVRVIAATNRDLLGAVAAKSFREDLYYRLSVFPIRLPPLRERQEDIPLLAKCLLDKLSARIARRFDGIDPETLRRLVAYRWPGNVRELQNVLERAVILATGPMLEIGPDVLGQLDPAPIAAAPIDLKNLERAHILSALRAAHWVIEGPQGAAVALGLHPNTLRSRLKKLGISRSSHEIS